MGEMGSCSKRTSLVTYFSADVRRGIPEAPPEFTDEEGSDSEDSDGDPSSGGQGCEEESSSSDGGLVALKASSNTTT